MTIITETLGRRLRASRALVGMDQQQIADAVGVARTTVSGWERGEFEPTASRLFAWSRITKQPLSWFAEGLDSDERARRDSNPQPSDWESVAARLILGMILCQFYLDADLRNDAVAS